MSKRQRDDCDAYYVEAIAPSQQRMRANAVHDASSCETGVRQSQCAADVNEAQLRIANLEARLDVISKHTEVALIHVINRMERLESHVQAIMISYSRSGISLCGERGDIDPGHVIA